LLTASLNKQLKEDETGREHSKQGREMSNVYKIFVGKPERKKTYVKSRGKKVKLSPCLTN
jgi:hypothetical protein